MSAIIALDIPRRRRWTWPQIIGTFIALMGILMISRRGGLPDQEPPPEEDPCETAIWIGQSSAGAANGTSAANRRALTYFTTGANWGGGGAEIDAGDTVCLDGTITGGLTAAGDGSSGNYVTIDGTNATLGTSVEINNNSNDWLYFQNMTWADGASQPLRLTGGHDIVIDGFYTDDNLGLGFLTSSVDNVTIKNGYARSTDADLGNDQYDMLATDSATDVLIEGNHIELRIDGQGGSAHNDIIQTWGTADRLTIRYNRIVLSCTDPQDRSWLMIEFLNSPLYVYRNVFEGLNGCGTGGNGISAQLNEGGFHLHLVSNTFVAKDGPGNIHNLSNAATLTNNVYHIEGNTGLTGSVTPTWTYAHWFGSSIPSCSGHTGSTCGTDPGFTNYSGGDYSLGAGSVDIDAGTDMGVPYDMALDPAATWPNPTLKAVTGTWDRGAFER